MEGGNPVERAVFRDTWIEAACIAGLAVLAWWWLFSQSSMIHRMPAMDHDSGVWTPNYLISAFTMWVLMMVAMMLPSAAPMILFYARVSRKAANGGANTLLFAFSYVGLWASFSVLAVLLQATLVSASIVTGMALALENNRLSAGLLVAAGLYQLSPLKTACLDQCQSPLFVVMRLWRPGWKGALRLGLRHGLYCLGCCWMLMLLLFVGGVMNLAWIAMLSGVVFAEKILPPVVPTRKITAAILFLGGVLILFAGKSVH